MDQRGRINMTTNPKTNNLFIAVIIAVLMITLVIVSNSYYNYWYDNEYPHGELQCSPETIEIFYGGWYCDIPFIKIGQVYEIQDFDVEQEMLARFNDWHNVNYTVVESEYCEGQPMRTYVINDTRDFSFEIEYHTYDRQRWGIDPWYSKQLVIDSFRIAGWKS